MKVFFISLLKLLLGQWVVFYIYSKPVEANSHVPDLFELTHEKKSSSTIKVDLRLDNEVVSSLSLMWGEDYLKRNYIKLKSNEAKVISVETEPQFRGKGYGKVLLQGIESIAAKENIDLLFARIWHSNTSSIKLFEKSGWQKHTTKIQLKILNLFPVELNIRSRAKGSR